MRHQRLGNLECKVEEGGLTHLQLAGRCYLKASDYFGTSRLIFYFFYSFVPQILKNFATRNFKTPIRFHGNQIQMGGGNECLGFAAVDVIQ